MTAPPTASILQSIGNTALVELSRMVPRGSAKIVAKLEWQNPTGSMKDRMAAGLLQRVAADGRLAPGDTVVEYTGGSTGTSLAFVCAAMGYPAHMISSRAFSQEKLDHMRAYGAQLTLAQRSTMDKQLFLDMIAMARELGAKPHTYWVNQLENPGTIPGYYALGEEIWQQTGGRVDAFVQTVGTCASLNGVATVFKRYNPNIKIIAVEPAETAVLSGGAPGAHDIEGIGIGFTPPLWNAAIVDEIIAVRTETAKETARRLAREEALFAGTSSGANVYAALRVAQQLGEGATVATLMIDSGLKYVSTDLYRTGG